MTWTLNASGHTPAGDEPDPAARDAAEQSLFDEIQEVLSRPEHGAGASTFSGNFVSGAPHHPAVALSLDPALRHASTTQVLRHFQAGHLPPHLARISKQVGDLARSLARQLDDGPELTTGLRKLLEAKDAFVRAAIESHGVPVPEPSHHHAGTHKPSGGEASLGLHAGVSHSQLHSGPHSPDTTVPATGMSRIEHQGHAGHEH